MSSSDIIIEENRYYWIKLDTFPVWPVKVFTDIFL